MSQILNVLLKCNINNLIYAFIILILATALLVPPPIVGPVGNSHKIPTEKNIQPRKPHDTLDKVDNPTIVSWSSKFLRKIAGAPQSVPVETFSCGDIICDYYDYPIMLPNNVVGAYIFYGALVAFTDLPLPREPERKIWGLFNEESPKYIPDFMFEAGLTLFNYSSTFSRYSDVPFPLQWLSSHDTITSRAYFIPTSKKNSLLLEISPILYLQTVCKVPSERDSYVRELMKYQRIDSYGTCLKNKEIPKTLRRKYWNRLEDDDVLKFIARYKFVLALENAVCDDYVTEKFWRAIRVGIVPIYFGTPTIKFWMPNEKSAILIQDFPTPKLLSDHIDKLMRDDDLYEEYLEHKTKGIIRNKNILNEIMARPHQYGGDRSFNKFQCFLCDKLHNFERIPHNRLVNKSHYNCPIPISVLTLKVNPSNAFVSGLNLLKTEVERNIHFIKTFKGNQT